MLEGRAIIQTLIGWNIAWTWTVWALDKDTVLHLGRNNPSTSAVWGLPLANFSFFSSAEKDIGIWVGASQMNQQSILAVAKPNCFMGCISENLPSRTKDLIMSLYSALLKPCLEKTCVQFWSSQFKRHWETGRSSEKGQHDDQRIRTPDIRKKALFYSSWVKRSFFGKDLITAF